MFTGKVKGNDFVPFVSYLFLGTWGWGWLEIGGFGFDK